MKLFRSAGWVLLACLTIAPTAPQPAFSPSPSAPAQHKEAGSFSVMTYNVKGLPWPLASDRGPALAEIGERLAVMREEGVQPEIVLLQEAFTGDAKAIGRRAGYRYSVSGPVTAPVSTKPPLGPSFAQAARRDRGEGWGTVLDSGLVILSDYPIVRSKRMAFPQGACAGFDCLASKGVVIAWVDVPGREEPVAIANTHLNSRASTHVSLARADDAHAWQMKAVRDFVSRTVSPDAPIVFGGDFNVGTVPRRQSALANFAPLGPRQKESAVELLTNNLLAGRQAEQMIKIAKDKKDLVLTRAPSNGIEGLSPRYGAVIFPDYLITMPLSDHPGYMVEFGGHNFR